MWVPLDCRIGSRIDASQIWLMKYMLMLNQNTCSFLVKKKMVPHKAKHLRNRWFCSTTKIDGIRCFIFLYTTWTYLNYTLNHEMQSCQCQWSLRVFSRSGSPRHDFGIHSWRLLQFSLRLLKQTHHLVCLSCGTWDQWDQCLKAKEEPQNNGYLSRKKTDDSRWFQVHSRW